MQSFCLWKWEKKKNGTATLENSLALSYTVRHTLVNIRPNNPVPRNFSEKNENIHPNKILHVNVSTGFTLNCPKLDSTQMSINQEMDIMDYYSALERSISVCSNMDKSQIHYAGWKNLGLKGYLKFDSIYYDYSGKDKTADRNHISGC